MPSPNTFAIVMPSTMMSDVDGDTISPAFENEDTTAPAGSRSVPDSVSEFALNAPIVNALP